MTASAPFPRRRPKLTIRAVALIVVVIALLVAIASPIRQYLRERGGLAELERGVAELEADNEVLRREIGRLHDPVYIEYVARKCLGMVKKGEWAFVTVPEGEEPAPPDC
jgi:cell division protein FtsB